MNEVYYLIFSPGKIVTIFRRPDDPLPREYYGLPYISMDDGIWSVVLTELVIQDEFVYEMIRAKIEEVISVLKAYGPVRVAFPVWDRMLIHLTVEPTENDYECADLDWLLDSFLSLRGPEIIL